MRGWLFVIAMIGPSACGARAAQEARQSTGVDFDKVKAVFEQNCYKCHGPDKQNGRLRLDVKAVVFSPDRDEPIIVPGDPNKSLLYRLINLPADDKKRMPKKADPLSPEQIELIGDWINAGAVWPDAEGGDHRAVRRAPSRMKIELAPLSEEQEQSEATAIRAVRKRGGLASRVAADTIGLDVNFALTDNVADDDLALLAGSEPTLVWLNLAGAPISDKGLSQLAEFGELRRLHLERTSIGDAGLNHIVGLGKLHYLNLYGTAVTDDGLERLAKLKGLRKLYLWDTKVTDAGVEVLQAALPDLVIDTGKHRLAAVEKTDDKKLAAKLPGCCQTAVDGGKTCDHACCVEAAKADQVCPKCSKG